MEYIWKNKNNELINMNLELLKLDFKILNKEMFSDKDYPFKPNFKHPWEKWAGVDVQYLINDKKIISGYRGRTCWYIPAKSQEDADFLKIKAGEALKIIKHPETNSILEEYERLIQEFTIQKILFSNDMSTDIKKIILVQNSNSNNIEWFNEDYFHPRDCIYFAIIVEHLEIGDLRKANVEMDKKFFFHGKSIDDFIAKCKKMKILHHDIGLGNMFFNYKTQQLNVIDVHKWKRTYEIKTPNVPRYLQLELNNTCNGKCKMCNIPKMKRKTGYMSDSLFENILLQARELKIENIVPFLHGEPFIRKDYIDKLKLINKLVPFAKITIFTNASLLNSDFINGLLKIKNIEQLVFSFAGGNKTVYEKVTGLDFEKTINNIKKAVEVLNNVNIRISMPKCLENQNSEKDFMELWSKYECSTYDTYNYLGYVNNSLCPPRFEHCDRAIRSMVVLYDGRVCLCCMDSEGDVIFGDLSKEKIIDVWKNKKFKEFRRKHIVSRLYSKPCNICTQELRVEEYYNT